MSHAATALPPLTRDEETSGRMEVFNERAEQEKLAPRTQPQMNNIGHKATNSNKQPLMPAVDAVVSATVLPNEQTMLLNCQDTGGLLYPPSDVDSDFVKGGSVLNAYRGHGPAMPQPRRKKLKRRTIAGAIEPGTSRARTREEQTLQPTRPSAPAGFQAFLYYTPSRQIGSSPSAQVPAHFSSSPFPIPPTLQPLVPSRVPSPVYYPDGSLRDLSDAQRSHSRIVHHPSSRLPDERMKLEEYQVTTPIYYPDGSLRYLLDAQRQ